MQLIGSPFLARPLVSMPTQFSSSPPLPPSTLISRDWMLEALRSLLCWSCLFAPASSSHLLSRISKIRALLSTGFLKSIYKYVKIPMSSNLAAPLSSGFTPTSPQGSISSSSTRVSTIPGNSQTWKTYLNQ